MQLKKIMRFLIMILVTILVKLRWIYFHVNPSYKKFYMDSSHTEAHFFHAKTNSIHSNLVFRHEEPIKNEVARC